MIKKKLKNANATFRLTPSFKRRVESAARKQGKSFSKFVSMALLNELRGCRAVILQGTDKDIQRTVDAFVRSAQKPKSTP